MYVYIYIHKHISAHQGEDFQLDFLGMHNTTLVPSPNFGKSSTNLCNKNSIKFGIPKCKATMSNSNIKCHFARTFLLKYYFYIVVLQKNIN
jgi:hypothetical protein